MTERVVKVYPKQEQLEQVVKTLQLISDDLLKYRQLDESSRAYLISTCSVEIANQANKIRSLYESNT